LEEEFFHKEEKKKKKKTQNPETGDVRTQGQFLAEVENVQENIGRIVKF